VVAIDAVQRPAASRTPQLVLASWYVALTVVIAATALQEVPPSAGPDVPWWLLAAAFALAHRTGVGIVDDRRVLPSPIARIPLVIGLYLASPLGLLAAQVVGSAVGALPWRIRGRETVETVAATTLATALGVWTYLAMTEPHIAPRGPAGWADGLVAAGVVSVASLALASIRSGPDRRTRTSTLPWIRTVLMTDVLAVATGLVAAEIIRTDRHAIWLLVLPAAAAYALHRQYRLAGWRADALQTLHEATRAFQRSADHVEVAGLAAEQARTLCRARSTEIVLRGPDGGLVHWRAAGGEPQMELTEESEAFRTQVERLRPDAGAVVGTEEGGRRLRWGPCEDALVPVVAHGETIGLLKLSGRGSGRRFSQLELGVVETLVAGLGVTLETIRNLDDLAERHRQDAEFLARLDRVNRELRRVSEAKSVFLATSSHELRAPLTALLAETELLDRFLDIPGKEAACRQLVIGARANTRQLRRLVDDLLDLSSIEAGRLELRQDAVDLAQVAREVTSALRPALEAEGIELALGSVTYAPMLGDAGRLWQVATNLIENAGNATEAGGSVRLDVTVDERCHQLTVTDTGVGIASDQLERMFAPFEQGPERSRGLGLGLTIARHLVEQHHGTLVAESTLGRGSCFAARFPVAPPDELL
jgi:signal transduction histidine kinase